MKYSKYCQEDITRRNVSKENDEEALTLPQKHIRKTFKAKYGSMPSGGVVRFNVNLSWRAQNRADRVKKETESKGSS